MNWKNIGKKLLFPGAAVLLPLLPVSIAGLVYTMRTMEEAAPMRIASYVLAFYALMVWCIRVPCIIRRLCRLKKENPYVVRWRSDARLRANITLTGNVLWNGAYAALQLWLGVSRRSMWCFSLAAYYLTLGVMRAFLVRYTLRHKPGEKMEQERKRYRACGWIFLLMNLALSGMMLYMIRESGTASQNGQNEIATIAMATYTFATLAAAIISAVRYKKFNSPVLSATRAISLAAACVSLLTLENTMLATFGSAARQTRRIFLGLSGGGVSLLIIIMAIYMIAGSKKPMKRSNQHGKQRYF